MQGKIINGFTLLRKLGEGGMAEVWYAENEIGKAAAVKILNENLSHNEQIVERFHNEALVMVKLEHPNIRQVYGYGYIDNRHCIVMEYLEGDDLDALLKAGRKFTDEELQRWWNQTVDALNYTHAMGIVHRDIKPSNLFLDKNGNIKLLDFGIAKVKESISMTRTGALMGTLMYMSPEQVRDTKNIDYRTDVYSLAVSFAQLVSGSRPYDCEKSDDFEIREQIVYKPLDLKGLPPAWQGFLAPYLEKDPQKRPALRHFEPVMPKEEPAKTVVDKAKAMVVEEVRQPEPKPVVGPAPKPTQPEPQPTAKPQPQQEEPKAVTLEPSEKPKSKKGLWIGLGAAAVLVAAVVVALMLKRSAEPSDVIVDNTPTIALFPVSENGKWGYIDVSGNMIIAPQYDEVRDFREGMAAVMVDDLWGFINTSGETVVPLEYEFVYDYSEGLAKVSHRGRIGYYVDKTGKIIEIKASEDCFDWGSFHEGLVKVKFEYSGSLRNESFVNKSGKEVTDRYSIVKDFSEGLARVENYSEDTTSFFTNSMHGYIDKSGNQVIDLKYYNACDFSEGLAAVSISNTYGYDERWGFIDKNGNEVISFQFDAAGDFSEGLAAIAMTDGEDGISWGFINKLGVNVIAPEYIYVCSFHEGLACVRSRSNEKWGFIDPSGNVVVDFQYDGASGFRGGLALVAMDDYNMGYIDKTGKLVYSFKLEGGMTSYRVISDLKVRTILDMDGDVRWHYDYY